ncbi:MAG: tetratricopeptide repeat protein [Candidatus Omnitrophica bacterium]|nr:tetratricopeptide repeat protein [Candidatus Omnitrophota bacterium]
MAIISVTLTVKSYAKDSLDRAYKSYILGDFNTSLVELKEGVHYAGGDEMLYLAGMDYLELGDYEGAREYFRRVINNFKDNLFYQPAQIKYADTYFLETNYTQAQIVYASILEKNSAPDYLPRVYLRLAQVSAKLGQWEEEKKYIKKIRKEFPGSVEEYYVDILENRGYFFTIQVGAFSEKVNAYELMQKLEDKYPAYWVEEEGDEVSLYKVRVGKYQDRADAVKVYHALVEDGYPARIFP